MRTKTDQELTHIILKELFHHLLDNNKFGNLKSFSLLKEEIEELLNSDKLKPDLKEELKRRNYNPNKIIALIMAEALTSDLMVQSREERIEGLIKDLEKDSEYNFKKIEIIQELMQIKDLIEKVYGLEYETIKYYKENVGKINAKEMEEYVFKKAAEISKIKKLIDDKIDETQGGEMMK